MYNANNYGYNPYGRYIPQQPDYNNQQNLQQMMQPVNNSYKLNGKTVDSLEVVKAIEYPLDGSISYFPLADGSAIVSKQLQNDGTSKITIYKPSKENEKEQPKFVTIDELEKSISDIVIDEINDLKDEIKDIKQELKDIKKKKKDD